MSHDWTSTEELAAWLAGALPGDDACEIEDRIGRSHLLPLRGVQVRVKQDWVGKGDGPAPEAGLRTHRDRHDEARSPFLEVSKIGEGLPEQLPRAANARPQEDDEAVGQLVRAADVDIYDVLYPNARPAH